MKFIILTAACVVLLVKVGLADLYDEYDHYASLDEDTKYKLYWTYNLKEQEVSFAVEVRTTGWVGFGISSGNGKMVGSDLVIGWVKDCKGYLTDRYADDYSVPVLDNQQDYHLTAFSEKNGTTILKFKRKVDTCDKRDKKIVEGTTKVIFSYHDEDPASMMDLKMHTEKGARSLMLLNAFKGSSPEDLKDFIDVVNTEVPVPSSDTTYWCHVFEMPKLDKKYHIVKHAPIISPGNEGLVHHIIVYLCEPGFNETMIGRGNICEHENMPDDVDNCRRAPMLAAWAIGGKEFVYPNHTGFPIGTPDSSPVVMIETHYDNPKGKKNQSDSSGIRFYYTKPRKYDAAILMTGWDVDDDLVIPPEQQEWISNGYCPEECTNAGLKNTSIAGGGINAFSILLHTHLAGRKIKLRHIRNSTELATIGQDDNYDFNFQEMQHLPQEIKILPGDELITECGYNTMDRKNPTVGGEASSQEMCLSFVMYYPMADLSMCLSRNQGIRKLKTLYKDYRTQSWNQTMVDHLKNYNRNADISAVCKGQKQWLLDYKDTVQQPKVLSPLQPDKDSCSRPSENSTTEMTSSDSTCSGAGGLDSCLYRLSLPTAFAVFITLLANFFAI